MTFLLLNNNITTSATTTAANAAPAKRFGRTDESGVHRILKHSEDSEDSTNQRVVFVYIYVLFFVTFSKSEFVDFSKIASRTSFSFT